jgi:tetratricopeptide (TPR) repeat protein
VTLHNLVRGGDLVLVASQGGVNFYIGNHPEADGATAIVPGTRPTWQGGYLDSVRIAEAAEGRTLKPSEVSRYWYRRALSFMTNSPGQAISLLWRKTVLFWNAFLIGLPLPSFGLLAPLGMAGLLLAFGGRRGSPVGSFARPPAALLLAAFIAVTSLTTIAFFVNTRYRLPTQMILAVFAGVALADWMGAVRSGPPREGGHSRAALVASVAVALALLPLMGVNHLGLEENPAIGMHLMGIAWRESGNDTEALREFHRAAGQSGNPLAHASFTEAARILMAAGREAEAFADLRRAVRLAPGDADARSAMAEILFSRGDLDGARLHLEAALAGSTAAGRDPDLHYRLGLVARMQGRIDQAMRAYRAALEIAPSHPEANTNLGQLLSDTGEVREALRYLQRAVAEAPDLAPARYALAVALLRAGDRKGAREQARLAESLGARLDPALVRALQDR